jgi:hypothetical protein
LLFCTNRFADLVAVLEARQGVAEQGLLQHGLALQVGRATLDLSNDRLKRVLRQVEGQHLGPRAGGHQHHGEGGGEHVPLRLLVLQLDRAAV